MADGSSSFLENSTDLVAGLDCGKGDNPDFGLDICAVTDKDMNGFGEDTEKPTSYILSLGELSDTLVTSATGDALDKVNDKVEVGALMGTDDGDGSYFIRVSGDNDPTKTDDLFFSGTVEQGGSFEAAGNFGSETFIHIFSSDGGTLLQTINYHTSCSSPLIIGDQYGSITLEGATLEGKDSGTIYTVGQTEIDGDAGVVYEITGGNDADDFTVDPDTGEVTFITPPDFENPTDSDGDNKYDVEVTAFFLNADGSKGEICKVKPLEVCVEDDCINVLENTSPVIADLDCGKGDNPDLGTDICAVTHKEMNGFGEDTDKPTSYILNLGDELTSEINSTQGDKLEVGSVMSGDDGNGSYYVVVTRESDATKSSNQFFAGTVAAGESFTASQDAFGTSFGSETFVHIFSSDGGTLLQTINFHTSCSAPLVIGDQYGSVSLAGATVVGKDTGTIYQIGSTEAAGDAGVVYEITGGNDADDFTVDPDTGEVTFITPPDFENPTDSDGDNKYDVEVTAFFLNADGSKGEICKVKPLEVCVEDDCINVLENTSPVIADLDCGKGDNPDLGTDICAVTHKEMNGFGEDTDKPTSYILNLGDELTSEINSTQGDKLEVGSVMSGDDGNGSYYVVVTRESDATKSSNQFFAGTVAAGESFTASQDAFGTSFGSETFVHIFSSDGGTLLQTINFHTSCSAPLVIGDQYGSVSLAGATVVGKDTGTIYQIGSTEAAGDAGVVYEITGGNDADDFTVDPDTGEVTFITPPDFENPTDSDGDNKYDVEVTAFFLNADGSKGEICKVKPLEVCVEDDCINVLENTSPVIADLDCGKGDNPDLGTDICAVTHKEMNGFGEDTDKPTSYILNLGDELTSEINSTQGDKLEVGSVMSGDDGNGSYYVVVTRESDATKSSNQFFAGTVAAGESFTASQDAFGTSFGSETFVHIFSSDGGTLLQTINFHTSCSAPLVIGDQYGSVSLAGATVVGKDTGTIYQIGSTEAAGDAGVVYEITGGNDADDFTVDPDTGEVTFITPPDFENPTDSDGDNKYDVEVTAFFLNADGSKGEICEVKPLEVCVEDQECISILENTNPGVIADLDCEDKEPDNPDTGKEICAERDALKDTGIDTTKPTQLTLTLNDSLESVVNNAQEGSKFEISEFGLSNADGGGLYIIVNDDNDPADTGSVYFSGDVNFGESFTAVASAGGRNEFASETFIHIYDKQNDNLLQTINYHTSCSAPITIGDQLGLVSLDGVGLEDKDTGDLIEFGGAESREVVYEITGGDGYDPETMTSPLFNVDPANGEVTLAFTPDFENPLDDNGDNNYFVEVTGYFINADGTREVCEVKPIEICVEDQFEPGSLSGRYFCDTNDNDLDDGQATDPGVAGVRVALFDAAGNAVATATTGAQGLYSFTGLVAGSYAVQFTDPDNVLGGKQLVDPNVGIDDTIDSDAIGDTTLSTIAGITVTAGADTPDNDAGAEKTASLGDKVFRDTDRDGIQDAGEAGVAGVTVTLTGGGADGVIGTGGDDTTTVATTGADGLYLFDGLNPGEEYKVTFSDLPADTEFTTPGQGGDIELDSDADPANGMTQIVTLASGEANLSLDAGIVDKLGSLSGRYFCDTDNDDLDGGQAVDPGVAGVLVILFDAAGNEVARTTTSGEVGEEGTYSFGNLAAGTYSVQFTDPDGVLAGKQLVAPNVGGDDAVDSDAIGNTIRSKIEGITVNPGADTPDNDAGAEKTASLGDKVFRDTDRDGIQDAGEAGVAGVTVTLTGGGADGVIGTGGDDTTTVATTGADGLYLFDGLNPGEEYKVTFSDLPADTEFTTPGQGGDIELDSDADPANGMTQIVTLASGEANLSLDAGIVDKLGSLSGRYFCDTDNDDLDGGQAVDPGVAGVLVILFDAAGNEVARTTTSGEVGEEGTYSFGNLAAGTYSVQFTDPDGVLAGKQLVAPNVGGDDAVDSDAIGNTIRSKIEGITVNPGADTPDNDAGAEKTASLGDKVFRDTDRDGIQDAGEAGVAGVTVTLTGGGADGVIGTGGDDTTTVATTGADGLYLFDGLNPGEEYKVTFSDLPADTEFTTPGQGGDIELDSDADPANGMTQIVTLASGEANLSLDAGIVDKLGSLSGRYFCDTDNDDLDGGQAVDPGVAGVLVILFDAAGNEVARTTTSGEVGEEGTYSFGNLAAGTYSVQFTDPDGVLAGKQLVAPNVGGDDAVDSDAIGNTIRSKIEGITVNPGADTPDNDAGAEKTASLGDKVFRDTDRDGIQDAGEAGVAGVTVTLTGGGADGVIGTGGDDTTTVATTGADGLYLFDGLNPGEEYKVTFSDLPADTEFTTPGQGGDIELDSDADPANGMTQIVTLAPGEENRTLDAGLVDPNIPPTPEPDSIKLCADEIKSVNILANDIDLDGGTLTVDEFIFLGADGTRGGGDDVVIPDNGIAVTLATGAKVSFDGATFTYDVTGADTFDGVLGLGQEFDEFFEYTVSDGQGGTTTSAVDVTVCGTASIETVSALLEGASVEFSIDISFNSANLLDAYTIELLSSTSADIPLGTYELAYCFDSDQSIGVSINTTANVLVLTPENAALVDIDSNPLKAENVDAVNWLLNNDYTQIEDIDGQDGNYTDLEVQEAIWTLMNGNVNYINQFPNAELQDNENGIRDGIESATLENIQEIVDAALVNGEGFVPGNGDVFGLILDPTGPLGQDQPFIIGIEYDCLCL